MKVPSSQYGTSPIWPIRATLCWVTTPPPWIMWPAVCVVMLLCAGGIVWLSSAWGREPIMERWLPHLGEVRVQLPLVEIKDCPRIVGQEPSVHRWDWKFLTVIIMHNFYFLGWYANTCTERYVGYSHRQKQGKEIFLWTNCYIISILATYVQTPTLEQFMNEFAVVPQLDYSLVISRLLGETEFWARDAMLRLLQDNIFPSRYIHLWDWT